MTPCIQSEAFTHFSWHSDLIVCCTMLPIDLSSKMWRLGEERGKHDLLWRCGAPATAPGTPPLSGSQHSPATLCHRGWGSGGSWLITLSKLITFSPTTGDNDGGPTSLTYMMVISSTLDAAPPFPRQRPALTHLTLVLLIGLLCFNGPLNTSN